MCVFAWVYIHTRGLVPNADIPVRQASLCCVCSIQWVTELVNALVCCEFAELKSTPKQEADENDGGQTQPDNRFPAIAMSNNVRTVDADCRWQREAEVSRACALQPASGQSMWLWAHWEARLL